MQNGGLAAALRRNGKTFEVPEDERRRRDIVAKACMLPALTWAKDVPWRHIERENARVGRGFAQVTRQGGDSTIRWSVTTGPRATEADYIGICLHELAHVACYLQGESWGDADWDFGVRCTDAFAQWNEVASEHGYPQVDVAKWGPYRGQHGRLNADARKQAFRRDHG